MFFCRHKEMSQLLYMPFLLASFNCDNYVHMFFDRRERKTLGLSVAWSLYVKKGRHAKKDKERLVSFDIKAAIPVTIVFSEVPSSIAWAYSIQYRWR